MIVAIYGRGGKESPLSVCSLGQKAGCPSDELREWDLSRSQIAKGSAGIARQQVLAPFAG